MNTLFAKLSLALILIVGFMGAAFFVVDRINTRAYYDELSQQLNAPIAMYVTAQSQLISQGEPDLDALREFASHAMVINPTAEIYLLDQDGRILGHNMPEETVNSARIDLAPVQSLIAGDAQFPIHGDDPRSEQRKVFSAWPVETDGALEGYLYVVLGGQKYDELANNIGDSYAARSSVMATVIIVALTATIGLLVFNLLTRRLKQLNLEMQRVTASHFEEQPDIRRGSGNGDEIDALTDAFVDMSSQIRTQIDQLKENDRLRRELVTNISHDLRTPLAAIQGYIDTLMVRSHSMTAEDREQYLTIAQKHAVRLGSLISDLFELSKLEAASVTPSLETFSLPELVQDTAQEFRIEAERKNVALEIEAGESSAMTVGDIGLIQRVLENLVRNAIQYAPVGGEVTISITERPKTIAVSVSDNGPGIAEQDVPRIFDRFYRAPNGKDTDSDSSGLGLAIAKRILDLHDSRIAVSSKLDVGTRFEFELPLHQQAA